MDATRVCGCRAEPLSGFRQRRTCAPIRGRSRAHKSGGLACAEHSLSREFRRQILQVDRHEVASPVSASVAIRVEGLSDLPNSLRRIRCRKSTGGSPLVLLNVAQDRPSWRMLSRLRLSAGERRALGQCVVSRSGKAISVQEHHHRVEWLAAAIEKKSSHVEHEKPARSWIPLWSFRLIAALL